jgi:hypothetical protein
LDDVTVEWFIKCGMDPERYIESEKPIRKGEGFSCHGSPGWDFEK